MKEPKIKRINVDGEEVCLAKSNWGYGYRIVHPVRDSDGKINYWNFFLGGKSNAKKLLFYLIIIVLLYVGIQELISGYQHIAENPCEYCKTCGELINKILNPIT